MVDKHIFIYSDNKARHSEKK